MISARLFLHMYFAFVWSIGAAHEKNSFKSLIATVYVCTVNGERINDPRSNFDHSTNLSQSKLQPLYHSSWTMNIHIEW